jgi:hypothetical protein
MWYWGALVAFVDTFEFWLKWDKGKGHFINIEEVREYQNVSRLNIISGWKNIRKKVVQYIFDDN